jgi:8-hydroxy-5-deazaflavin:NADPH oxidoreductase
VRNPTAEKTQALLSKIGGKARAVTPAEAAASGDFIVLTTPWPQAEAAIRSLGNLNRKIILDATNPLAMGPNGLGLEIGHSVSAGEKVQGWAAGASVFKTLNTTGFRNMAEPIFDGVKSVMFVAGDDAANKPKVIDLVASLGFDVIDAGPLRNARLLEAHAMLWIELSLQRGLGPDWTFARLKR